MVSIPSNEDRATSSVRFSLRATTERGLQRLYLFRGACDDFRVSEGGPKAFLFVTTTTLARGFSEETAPSFGPEEFECYANIHFEFLWALLRGETAIRIIDALVRLARSVASD